MATETEPAKVAKVKKAEPPPVETPEPGAPMPPPPAPAAATEPDAADLVAFGEITADAIAWCQDHGFKGASKTGAHKWVNQEPARVAGLRAHAELVKGSAPPPPQRKATAAAEPEKAPAVKLTPEEVGMVASILAGPINAAVTAQLRRKRLRPAGGSRENQEAMAMGLGAGLVGIAEKYGWFKPEFGPELALAMAAGSLLLAVAGSAKAGPVADDAELEKAWK